MQGMHSTTDTLSNKVLCTKHGPAREVHTIYQKIIVGTSLSSA